MSELPRVLAVIGPTASGKSRLAVALAERLGWPVLCCDSVQVYRGLDIGSAKVDRETRERVPHELIDLVEPDADFGAGDYAAAAWTRLAAGPGLLAGGTGFYLRAVAVSHSGVDDESSAPASDPRRAAFDDAWTARERDAPGAVHAELARRDPTTARAIHPRNVVRSLRALWLCEAHGRPVSQVRADDPPRPRCELATIVIDPDLTVLDRAIDARCDAMMRAGFLAEVENLVRHGYSARHKSMRSLGYRQLLDHLEGRCSLHDAVAAIKLATRQYARRQRAYFRHQLTPALSLPVTDPRWLAGELAPAALAASLLPQVEAFFVKGAP